KDREDDTLGGELVADHRADRDAREAPSHLLERRFKSRGVARLDHTFEAHLLDAREEAEPLAVIGVSHVANRGDLRHALDEDDTGNNGVSREMSGLVPLVAGEGVLPHRTDAWLELGDAVDQQERVAVWNERLDRGFVERGHRERV